MTEPSIVFPPLISPEYNNALKKAIAFKEEEAKTLNGPKKVVGPACVEFEPVAGYDEARKAAIKAAEEHEKSLAERCKTVGPACVEFEPVKE